MSLGFKRLIKAQEPKFSIFKYKHMIGMTVYVLARVEFNAAITSNITGCFVGRKYSSIVVICSRSYLVSFIATYATRKSAYLCVDFLLTFHTTCVLISTSLQNIHASEKRNTSLSNCGLSLKPDSNWGRT